MKNRIKEMLKNNKISYSIIIMVKEIYYNILRDNMLMFAAFLRSKNLIGKRYEELKKYKDIHKGERCFIIATGPSLTIEDVKLLKDEYTFSMNAFVKIIEEIGWAPTYYGIQDCFVYEKLEKDILGARLNDVFIGNSINKKTPKPKNSIEYPLAYCGREYGFDRKEYRTKFSDDIFSIVYDGYSITYSLIQIAAYMGFKEIYLLGCDCNYEKDKPNHFVELEESERDKTMKEYFSKCKDRMTVGYVEAKKYAEKNDIKIFNATRGGMLEVFPRVNLEEVVKKNEALF